MFESRFASNLPSIKASVITIPLLYLSIPWPYLKILHIQKLYNKALKLNRSLNVLFPRIVFQKDYTLKQCFLQRSKYDFYVKNNHIFSRCQVQREEFQNAKYTLRNPYLPNLLLSSCYRLSKKMN